MERFEYWVESAERTAALIDQMNERGREGWELVTALAPWPQAQLPDGTYVPLGLLLVYKRTMSVA